MNRQRRSDCPIAFSLDLIGDAWSLLIIRDMVFAGKQTFGEFLGSDEGIARNILSNRLARLEQLGLMTKTPHPTDKRKDLYRLTEAGLDLIPVLLALSDWGSKQEPETASAGAWLADVPLPRDVLVERIKETVRRGSSVFAGPGSLMEQFGQREA